MLQKMTRAQIIGTRPQLDATIASLHRLGVLHIEDRISSSVMKHLNPDETNARLQDELAFLAARVEALLRLLPNLTVPGVSSPAPLPDTARALAEWIRVELERVAPPLLALAQRRDELRAESLSLPRYESTLRKLAPLAVEIVALEGFDTAALLIDRRYRDVLDLLRAEVEQITRKRCELIARDVDEHTTAALLVYPREHAAAVQAALGQENITQVRLPKELAGRTFRDALAGISQRLAAIRDELAQIDAELAISARTWRARLEQWGRAIHNHLTELNARNRFSGTTYTFAVEGWLPASQLGRLRESLAREVGAQVMVVELPIESSDYEHAPVAFANLRVLQPFELLVRTMALPRYGSFDPTPVLALCLPLFFGVILGDVAYGAILFALTLWIQRRFKANAVIRSLAQVLMIGSVWAILFGVLYGEFFGQLGAQFGMRPLWMAREGEQILPLFALTLALGAAQIVLGLLLGVWQAWRERQRSELVSKVGMLIVLSAIFGMVGIVTSWLPSDFFTPSVIVLILGIVLVSAPAGALGILLGPLEVLETLGNILSYLRLAAIGLSSVYLALVANQMAGLVGNILVGVVIALLLHSLNFALGILSPTIQSLRLHYVEFFRQFYQDGGLEYRPFKLE